MPRPHNRLSARAIAALNGPEFYADRTGLYLRGRGETVRSWVFIWRFDVKRREMGLGAPPSVGLARRGEGALSAGEVVEDEVDLVAARSKFQIARLQAQSPGGCGGAHQESEAAARCWR